jgi:ATP-dependent Clp protease ATP-binding subunit ClpX
MIQVNTKNILFICGGAFDGIDKKIARRLKSQTIGYSTDKEEAAIDKDNLLQYVVPQDLKSFGLIPELIGRLPVLAHLNPLDQATLRSILTDPKNALVKQYVRLFEMDNVKLSFDLEVFDHIVSKAMEYKLGARGLRSICEAIMIDAMFDIPSEGKTKNVHITLEYAKEKLSKAKMDKLRAA